MKTTTLLFAGIVALTGCNATTNTPPVSQQTPTPASPAPSVPVAQAAGSIASGLSNADYVIETTATGRAPLKDGLYEEAIANSSSKNIVRLEPVVAYGDLNGDHAEDAAVTLHASSGGSGDFSYLAVVLNQDGAAKPVDSVFIGDRIIMKAIRIVDGSINVTWLDRKEGEPMVTRPTVEISKVFVLRDGKIVASAR